MASTFSFSANSITTSRISSVSETILATKKNQRFCLFSTTSLQSTYSRIWLSEKISLTVNKSFLASNKRLATAHEVEQNEFSRKKKFNINMNKPKFARFLRSSLIQSSCPGGCNVVWFKSKNLIFLQHRLLLAQSLELLDEQVERHRKRSLWIRREQLWQRKQWNSVFRNKKNS